MAQEQLLKLRETVQALQAREVAAASRLAKKEKLQGRTCILVMLLLCRNRCVRLMRVSMQSMLVKRLPYKYTT